MAPPSAHRDAQPSQLHLDSDTSAVVPSTRHRRKRARSNSDDTPVAACDACRLRKVRCDRRQPDCSNCRKAGIECSSSTARKRTNYMKELRDDFSVVLKRLDHVDQTLATLTDLIRQVVAQPSNTASSPSSLEDVAPRPTTEPLGMVQTRAPILEQSATETAPLSSIKTLMRQACGPFFESDIGGTDYGRSGENQVASVLQDQHVRAMLQKHLDDFPLKSCDAEAPVVGDMDPLTTPTRLIVTPLVEGYLEHFNSRTPIFEDAELHCAIDIHYSSRQQQNVRSWTLIINNIVLLELGLETQVAAPSSRTRI
ncbi:hypothetical protein AK830_g6025 [Neonectria ditissima]|uniref:Zn(2)-C6 fungal-type domain-containing protein n=1 Tax=Neonectria ditissima TaxID=78410 RepID=A0A0N8H719_9HYPO|nr:hypothetical protein AK830_g6025 [Neonectria ditissima]